MIVRQLIVRLLAGGLLLAACSPGTGGGATNTCKTEDEIKCPDGGYDPLAACLDKCAAVCPSGEPCLGGCRTACKGKFSYGPAACVGQCGADCDGDEVCLAGCFGGCAGKLPEDVAPPHTSIDAGPPGGANTSASFAFSCNEPSCDFACRVDQGAWFACDSPLALGPFADGAHVLQVRAYDAKLNYDPDPAVWSWTVDTFVPVVPPVPPVPVYPVKPTWQDRCYDDAVETACPLTGDAFYGQDAQYGAAATGFTAYAAVVTDSLTGLTWQRADDATQRTWQAAANYCDALSLGGYDDWRLPGSNELIGLVDYARATPAIDAAVFPGTKPSFYWAAQTASAGYAWAVLFSYGYAFSLDKTKTSAFVRCVR